MKPIPLRPDYTAAIRDQRRSYVRAATALALRQIQNTSAESILANWPSDARASLLAKGVVEPMKAADFVGSTLTAFLSLAPTAASVRLFETATKINLTGISSFSFPLASNFTGAQFIAEGAPLSVGIGDFSGMPLGPVKKIGMIGALSDELEDASHDTAEIAISRVLEIAVGKGLDEKTFSNSAATDAAPAGLLHNVTPLPAGASMLKDLRALVANISDAGIDTSSVVFIASSSEALAIKFDAGPYFNYPIIEADILDKTVIAVATAGLVVAGSGVPKLDVGKHVTLQMSAPAAPVVAAAPTRDLFSTSTYALKCTAYVTWSIAPGACAVITATNW